METTQSFTTKNQRISAQRTLDSRRQQQALELHPELRLDRVRRIESLLSSVIKPGRYPYENSSCEGIGQFVSALKAEVGFLEQRTAQLGHVVQKNGETIRRALSFLRIYGRIASLNYGDVPDEERGLLVQLLALEYRWCFAAAGTTPEIFKREIGRTGAR
uniref:Uncharacterized protein n=1 Tax=uncultured myxobacterium HF0070_11L13 TaxID=723554 RepID=E7C210_9BACT|nr:hypothetical protein [uncultured myxobacterium HF0070_11L13]